MLNPYLTRTMRESIGNIRREFRVALTPVPRPKRWVFIVGCYNSGTTLLAELLGRHPGISALPTEGHFITDQFVKDYEVGLPRMWCEREEYFRLTEDDDGPDVDRIKRQWAIRLDLSRPVLLEKSPPNSVRTRWLDRHFNPASFIVLVRNGYAVAEGIRRKADPRHLRNGWPIEHCARQWRRTYEVLEQDLRSIRSKHWLSYEALTEDPTREVKRILDFLELEEEPNLDVLRPLKIHERHEPLRNLNAQSIERLSGADRVSINRVAGDYLERYGYLMGEASQLRAHG